MKKLSEVFYYVSNKLKNCSESPEYETMILLEESTGLRKEIILTADRSFNKHNLYKFNNMLSRRINGEPLQYIIGKVNFLGNDIHVNNKTLIPRPETEFMTEIISDDLKKLKEPHVLEIGTGSGAISISLVKSHNNVNIIATDISFETLRICKKNISKNNINNRLKLLCCNLFEALDINSTFDFVISNPPYIPDTYMKKLSKTVIEEPGIALNGGNNGVELINSILQSTPLFLKKGGHLYLEIDELNIPYIRVPDSLEYDILNDQFKRKRILRATKL